MNASANLLVLLFPQHNVEGLLNSCPRVGGYLLGWACNRKNCLLVVVPLPQRSKIANLFFHQVGQIWVSGALDWWNL